MRDKCYKIAQTSELSSYLIVDDATILFNKSQIRLDSVLETGTYYIQFITGTKGVRPSNGDVTHLTPPKKIQHTTGTDSQHSFDLSPFGLSARDGLVIEISTTEFTLTKLVVPSVASLAVMSGAVYFH